MAGDEGRHVGRQEERDPRLVFGPAEPTDRRPRRPELVGVFESGEVVDLRGLREVGADRVDPDALSPHVHGEARREVRARCLHRGVHGLARIAPQALDGVAVHDRPLRLRVHDVERIVLLFGVRGGLQREQADLRSVAVRDHHLVLCRYERKR